MITIIKQTDSDDTDNRDGDKTLQLINVVVNMT